MLSSFPHTYLLCDYQTWFWNKLWNCWSIKFGKNKIRLTHKGQQNHKYVSFSLLRKNLFSVFVNTNGFIYSNNYVIWLFMQYRIGRLCPLWVKHFKCISSSAIIRKSYQLITVCVMICRPDQRMRAATVANQIFGGYLRSQGKVTINLN